MAGMRKLDDWTPLPAERKLAEEMATGLSVIIGDGTLPPAGLTEADPRVIRTSFLRALILSRVEGHPPHEKGVQVAGAYLLGDGPPGAATPGLDLEGCDLSADLALFTCRVPDLLLLRSTSLRNLYLDRSHLGAGLAADGLEVKGGVSLGGLEAKGEVRLHGAKLGGDLSCTGARLTAGEGGDALSADGLEAKGNVFLRGLVAQGAVRLRGAKLGGSLACEGARLTAGARGKALNAARMRVAGAFFLRKGAQVDGVLDLTAAEIGHFSDDPACWPQRHGDLLLDRCRYGAFTGTGTPVDAASRIRWLSLQDESRWGADFWPQPWEECARVLREMGHGTAARTILIEKEKRQRAARRARLWRDHLYEDAYWHGFWDRVIGATVRYGRQPLLAFAWLGLFLLLGAVIFGNAAGYGEINPNDPRILREAEWADCAAGRALAGGHPHQPACFLAQPEAASFPRFNAFVYSADTLIPVVSLEMQSYWIPDETKPRGAFARVYLWLHIAAGWALTLLAVAGFSGLIRTDNTR